MNRSVRTDKHHDITAWASKRGPRTDAMDTIVEVAYGRRRRFPAWLADVAIAVLFLVIPDRRIDRPALPIKIQLLPPAIVMAIAILVIGLIIAELVEWLGVTLGSSLPWFASNSANLGVLAGIAAAVLVYGSLLWIAETSARRIFRTKDGRCRRCKYAVDPDDPELVYPIKGEHFTLGPERCPECGQRWPTLLPQ